MRFIKNLAIVAFIILTFNGVSAQMMGGYGGKYSYYGMMEEPNISYPGEYYGYYQNYPYGYNMPMMGGYGGYGGYGMMGGGMMGGYGMMGAYPGYGMGYTGGFGFLFLLIIIAVVVIVYYSSKGKKPVSSAKEVLNMRLAKGEITMEEYKELLEAVEK